MKTRSAKAKGRRLQNPIAAAFRWAFKLEEADVHPALMGESGIDIKLSTSAREKIPYAIECKNVEKINVWDAIKQAEANGASEKLTPAVVLFRNRMPQPYVAIPWDTFMRLMFKDKVFAGDVLVGLQPFRDYMKATEEEEKEPE